MIPLTLHEIGIATGGRLVAPAGAELDQSLLVEGAVVTDSRLAGPAGLYVARPGEHADGHDYVPMATTAGAVAVLVQRELDDCPVAQIVVDDTETAFGLLARDVIEAAGPQLTVIAVTGSSGKTSTKDLLAHVLAAYADTVAAQESYNSEIGVPLTVCRITRDTRYLVVEMGARGIGHLRYLTTIAPPNIAVVLNVGHAHASEFGSLEAVRAAKSELVAALGDGGLAVLNADDERVVAMAPLAWADNADVAWFSARGVSADPPRSTDLAQPADEETLPMSERVDVDNVTPLAAEHVWAENVQLDADGRASFTLRYASPAATSIQAASADADPDADTDADQAQVTLQLVGAHHVGNALAVAAVALRVGMALPAIADALSTAQPASRWRMEVIRRDDGVTIVNDAYNANPDSMAAALNALRAMTPGEGGRRIAVLGTMLELGPSSDDLHAGVGALAAELGIDQVIVVGQGARPLADAAAPLATWFATADEARDLLAGLLQPGDIALFKSSRDSGLRWLGEQVAGS